MILIAFILASPLAYFIMDKWLERFAFRINISVWLFAIVELISLSIVFLSLAYQSVKAAYKNPVDAIRYE